MLTSTGLETLREADAHHIETAQRVFTDDLDEDELRVLAAVFTRLRDTSARHVCAPGRRGPCSAVIDRRGKRKAGIAHSEQSPPEHSASLYGAQLWVALPERERRVAPAFECHTALPRHESRRRGRRE